MRIIEPYKVTPTMMTASNVPETDHGAWVNSTTYALGDRVIRNHSIWESIQAANTGHNPENDALNAWWVRIGATNRWRAFDERLGGLTIGGTTITYTITLPRTLNALAFFSLNATSVRVKVTTPGSVVVHDETTQLVNRSDVGNFWEYIYGDFSARADVVMTNIPLPAGAAVAITITAGLAAEVAEIIFGNDLEIGTTLVDTSLGIVDYSKKDRDEWGGIFIVPKPVTSTVRFRFSIPTEGAGRVQQIMRRIASKLCIFYAVDGEDPFGTTIPGILRDYELTLRAGRSTGSIDAESLA